MLNNPLVRQTQQEYNTCATDERQRILWMAIRQALIISLGAIEDYLEMERSIESWKMKKKRLNG